MSDYTKDLIVEARATCVREHSKEPHPCLERALALALEAESAKVKRVEALQKQMHDWNATSVGVVWVRGLVDVCLAPPNSGEQAMRCEVLRGCVGDTGHFGEHTFGPSTPPAPTEAATREHLIKKINAIVDPFLYLRNIDNTRPMGTGSWEQVVVDLADAIIAVARAK